MNIPAIASATLIPSTAVNRPAEGGASPPGSAPPSTAAPAPRDATLAGAGAPPTGGTTLVPANQAGIQQALEEVREALAPVAQNLLFSLDEDSGRTVIKIVDSATDEVIRQIPSEEILAIAKALDKLQGVLIRQQA
jgi:flagellar protein FlaG